MSNVSRFNSKIQNLENDFLKAIHKDFVKLKSFVPELVKIRFQIYCTYNDEGNNSTYMSEEVLISFKNEEVQFDEPPYENEILDKYSPSKILKFINDVTQSDAETIFGNNLSECTYIIVNDKGCVMEDG